MTLPAPDSGFIQARDAMLALAFIGDLSMGRPTDHSPRTARLAAWLALASGGSGADCDAARCVALLRWSGCTANAAGFESLLGDDVAGRDALLTLTLPPLAPREQQRMLPLAEIHCEVSGEIGVMLGMGPQVVAGLRHIFERYDGEGMPGELDGADVPEVVYRVNLASDLEILSRAHGVERALAHVEANAGQRYPRRLTQTALREAKRWLAELDGMDDDLRDGLRDDIRSGDAPTVPLALVGDVIDLKLPWMAGYSRQAAELGLAASRAIGLNATAAAAVQRAALIHGIGRAALPNRLWNTPGKLHAADWERVRLMPYWTDRAARRLRGLAGEARLASCAYERLDGNGYFRGLSGDMLGQDARVLAVAIAWTALRARRPWREAMSAREAAAVLQGEAAKGRLDPVAVDATIATACGRSARIPETMSRASALLSERETEVLRRISLGESNKEVARVLAISPSTVRTHMESIFRKLECTTRAAATLKGFTLGLLQ